MFFFQLAVGDQSRVFPNFGLKDALEALSALTAEGRGHSTAFTVPPDAWVLMVKHLDEAFRLGCTQKLYSNLQTYIKLVAEYRDLRSVQAFDG